MRTAGYLASPVGMNATTVVAISEDPPNAEIDDEQITTNTLIIPRQLATYPYQFRLTLPANSPATTGLLLLASRQAPWTTVIPDPFIPDHLPEDLRARLLQQTPTIIRTNNTPPKPVRDPCSIYSPAFAGLTATKCLHHFRGSVIHTLYKLLTAAEYRQPHDTATMAAHLSPPNQALLQAIDTIQPATVWSVGQQNNSVTFLPSEIEYNPLRL